MAVTILGWDKKGGYVTSPQTVAVTALSTLAIVAIGLNAEATSVTLGGQAMTKLYYSAGMTVLYLLNPPTGNQSLAWVGGAGGGQALCCLQGNLPSAQCVANVGSQTGTSDAFSVTLTTKVAGTQMIGFERNHGGGGGAVTPTSGTETYDFESTFDEHLWSGYIVPTTVSTTISGTHANADRSAWAVEVVPPSGGSPMWWF